MDEELVEKVARALAIDAGWNAWDTAQTFSDTPSGNEPDEEREHYRSQARAAIQAMMDAGWQPPMTEAQREEVVKKIYAVYDEGLKSLTRNMTG